MRRLLGEAVEAFRTPLPWHLEELILLGFLAYLIRGWLT
jgi:hypothetical protein